MRISAVDNACVVIRNNAGNLIDSTSVALCFLLIDGTLQDETVHNDALCVSDFAERRKKGIYVKIYFSLTDLKWNWSLLFE